MKYDIEIVFVMFPLICFFIHILKLSSNKLVQILLGLLFVGIYAFSLNGSDIEGYMEHYDSVGNGVNAIDNGQEIGFYYLMRLSNALGFDYVTFRIVLLSVLACVLFLCICRFTDDFSLSLFLITSLFVIYTISTYRQYIVVVFSLMWFVLYCNGKKIVAIIGTVGLLLFHITAILPLLFMIYFYINTYSRINKCASFLNKNHILIIIFCLLFRVIAYCLLRVDLINYYAEKLFGDHASSNPSIFTFGLIARVIMLILIRYLYCTSKTDNNKIKTIFCYYYLSIMLYIAIPLEFFMGRLINNAYFFVVVLVPMLIKEIRTNKTKEKHVCVSRRLTLCIGIVAMIVLINQLTKQNGYVPYLNVLFGDDIKDIYLLNY